LAKLSTFHDQIVGVKVNMSQIRADKISKIEVKVPGKKVLFIKSVKTDLQESFVTAYDSIVSQLKKHKILSKTKKLKKLKRSRVYSVAA
jgi:ribosome-associated translation inhibitor RaiA